MTNAEIIRHTTNEELCTLSYGCPSILDRDNARRECNRALKLVIPHGSFREWQRALDVLAKNEENEK